MRHSILIAVVSALPALYSFNAAAHASLQPAEATPGTVKAVITIPHGCDGEATHTVRVEIPEGLVLAKPMPKFGWTLATETGDYGKSYELHGGTVNAGLTAVTWSGGELPDGQFDEFALRGTLAGLDEGQTLFFKTVQTCAAGEVAWVEIPEQGQDAHALEHPAPSLTILASSAGASHHHEAEDEAIRTGDLTITTPWARAMLPGQPSGGGYLTIKNEGTEDDRIVSLSSPVAGKVEIHTMEMSNEVMVMRPAEGGLAIPAGETVTLKPGGLHIMFMQVETPFKEGEIVPVTLELEKAGRVDVELPVGPVRGDMPMDDHSGHN